MDPPNSSYTSPYTCISKAVPFSLFWVLKRAAWRLIIYLFLDLSNLSIITLSSIFSLMYLSYLFLNGSCPFINQLSFIFFLLHLSCPPRSHSSCILQQQNTFPSTLRTSLKTHISTIYDNLCILSKRNRR